MLLRHALPILEHLSHHSEAENHDLRQRLTRANEVVKYNLAKLEILKPKINKRYHEYEKLRLRLSAEPNSSGGAKRTSERSGNQRSHGWYNDPALDGTKKPLQAYQDADMAVKIHRSEAHRKIAVKRLNAHHDVTTGKKELQHLPDGAWERQEGRLANKAEDSLGDLSTLMQKVHLPKDSQAKTEKSAQFKERPVEGYPSLGPVAYPKVPSKIGLSRPPTQFKGISKQVETLHPTRIPHIPPKLSASPSPPPVPKKISDVGSSVEGTSPTISASTSKRSSLNTRDYTFVPSAYLENGAPLRTMFLPPDLRHKFLDVAKSNTEQNLETCGFLCGTLVSNALFISRLVIPEQKSTSDTCEMTNESAFFDYCDAEELVVLGWIHTHPTQTCFMSSRDLHTHAAYQAMMAESIAIVCAPSHEPSYVRFPYMSALSNS